MKMMGKSKMQRVPYTGDTLKLGKLGPFFAILCGIFYEGTFYCAKICGNFSIVIVTL